MPVTGKPVEVVIEAESKVEARHKAEEMGIARVLVYQVSNEKPPAKP